MLSSYESERQLTDEERNIVDKYLEFAKVTRYSKYMEIKYYARQGEREKVESYLNQFLSC